MKGIGEAVPMKTLSFVNDACELLVQCHKVCVYILCMCVVALVILWSLVALFGLQVVQFHKVCVYMCVVALVILWSLVALFGLQVICTITVRMANTTNEISLMLNDCCLSTVRQMMIYACITEYFTTADGTVYLTFLVDDLDADTTSLQAFLGRTPPSITHSLNHSLIPTLSISRSLIHSISLDQSLTYSITFSINPSLIQSLFRSITHLFNHSLDQSLAYSISLDQSLAYSISLSITSRSLALSLPQRTRSWQGRTWLRASVLCRRRSYSTATV